jgi:nucleoside-triphosphatase THEP1
MNKSSRLYPVVVVGSKNSGKTAFLEMLVRKARNRGLHVAGFLSRGQWREGEKPHYFLLDLNSDNNYLLASETPHPSRPFFYGRYYFNPEIFEIGNRILKESTSADMLVLDEFGPLERTGKGFSSGFNHALRHFKGILVLAVRPSLLPFVLKQFSKVPGNLPPYQ